MVLKGINIGSYVVVTVFVMLLFRLFNLQVLNREIYREMSENNRLRIIKTPAPRGIIFDRNGTPLVRNIPYFSVSLLYNPKQSIDMAALASLLQIPQQEIQDKLNRKDNSPFVPVKLKQGLNSAEVLRIEANRSDFPGLFIETEVGRQYIYGKSGGHIIGYLGKISTAQQNNPELRHFPADALIGQWGIEALFDDKLRGVPGERVIEVDALGKELRLLQERTSVKGEDITLSIDINIQKALENAFGQKAGALVAIKPDTGEILALESVPSFDPNVFSMGIVPAEWKKLMEDKKNPLLNRAMQSQYPPGSTFKIVTAIAALEEGVIDPDTKIACKGGLSYGKWTFGCWKKGGHGSVNFHQAIVESCDVYFYELGRRLGMDKIFKYAKELGLGETSGLELTPVRERKGLIPNAEWKKEKKKLQWYLGDTFISSIGQGYVSATPVQMALMLSTVANGGTLYRPTLIKGEQHKIVRKFEIKPETLKKIKKALAGVVNEPGGTGQKARTGLAVVGGKTGTAQVVGRKREAHGERFMDHAWFVAVAPVEDPEIALAVFVEHGGGGGAVAAPIAKEAIDAFMNSKKQIEARTKKASDNEQAEHVEH